MSLTLSIIFLLPLISIFVFLLNSNRIYILLSSLIHFVASVFLLYLPVQDFYYIKVDFFASLFIFLTSLITFLCLIYLYNDSVNSPLYTVYILLTEICLIFFFSASHFLLFFAAFESVLIPLALIIGSFGSRNLRFVAALQLFYYTILSSFFMLLSFFYIYTQANTLSMAIIPFFHIDLTNECILWTALFFPLAVKTPLFPFHVWLPQAHVEAPTIGSVLLAALVLKMSGFGYIRILLPLCPRACMWFGFFVFCICIIGGSYAAFTAASQSDLKRIVAASSIVHMSYAVIGVFNMDSLSIISSIYAMFAHGLISAGLFFAIGCIYSRYGERDISLYTNLHKKMPRFSFAFVFLAFANLAFPGTANFPAEMGVFLGTYANNGIMPLLLMLPLVLNGAFNIWGATRLCFGPDKAGDTAEKAVELTFAESFVLYSCIAFILFFGCDTQFIMAGLEEFVKDL